MARDPVCGMTVEPETAAGQAEYEGEISYFCSLSCRDRFQAAPANMALTPAAPRHADGWAHAAAHVNHTQGLADAPPRLAGGNHGWDKIHAKMRQRRGQ